jgi:hypothetical protein
MASFYSLLQYAECFKTGCVAGEVNLKQVPSNSRTGALFLYFFQ